MFNIFKKQADVVQHWIAFADGFQLVPSEFYSLVEKAIQSREVPGLSMARVEFAEGGMLSSNRLYLRMMRERLVFDVCAAPFGNTFFFSCRFAEVPMTLPFWQIIIGGGVMLIAGLITFILCTLVLGPLGPIVWFGCWFLLFVAIVLSARGAAAAGFKDIDATLIKTPLIGPVYEAFFRKETYYRQDTRLMYLEIVSGIVKRLAEEAVAAKGAKLTRQYEQAPILTELYKPVKPSEIPTPPPIIPDAHH